MILKERQLLLPLVPPVDPSTTIDWPKGAPTDDTPTYTWSTEPDIWSQGQHPGVVKVTYNDGTSDLVPVTVDVTDAPSGKPTTVKQGDELPDAPSVINWINQNGHVVPGPSDPHTTYTWMQKPDTSTVGTKNGVVTVTYPNGEKTEVVVPVTVTPTSTTNAYDPYVEPQQYAYNPSGEGVPNDPTSLVKLPTGENAPAGVHYEWGTKPDTTKANTTQQAKVIATYPDPNDGTKTVTKTIQVIAHIGSMADYYNAKAGNLTVPYNANMDDYPASDQISIYDSPTHKIDDPSSVVSYDAWAPTPVTIVSGTQPTMIKVTYKDGSWDYAPLNVTVGPKSTGTLADQYPVSYNGIDLQRPTDDSPASNSADPQKAEHTLANAITGYRIQNGFDGPQHVTVYVNPSNGQVTVTAVKDSTLGSFNVPVQVSYSDGSTATVYVPVSITGVDPNGNYYGNQTMTSCEGSVPVLHKTTGSNTIDLNDASISKVQKITYNYNWDHTNGNGHYKAYKIFKINAAGTGYYLAEEGTQDDAGVNRVATHQYKETNSPSKFDNVHATWTWQTAAGHTFAPSTNVDAFDGNTGDTLYKNADGTVNREEQTDATDPTGLAGNSKWRMSFKIGDTAFLTAAGLPNFYSTTGTWTNTYFDFLGATAKTGLTALVGDNVPTDTTGIENYLNMGSLTTATPENGSLTSVTWAPGKKPGTNGKFVQGANAGTARLIFNNDPNNYLDIPVTITAANHVKPTDPGVDPDHPDDQHSDLFMSVTRKVYVNGVQNAGLTQTIRYARDKYTYSEGNVISYGAWKIGKVENGAWVDTPTANATFGQETAPSETGKDTYVQYGSDPSTKTKTNNIKAENVPTISDAQGYVTPQDGTSVYVTYADQVTNQATVTYTFYDDTGHKTVGTPVAVSGDEGQVLPTGLTIPKGYKLASGQTLPTTVTIPSTDTTVTIHLVHATKTIKPDDPGVDPNKPDYQDMFKTVTRTINVNNPDGSVARTMQQVHFNRSKTVDEVTGKAVSYGDWSLADGSARDWGEFNVPQLNGYTSYVDGDAATQVNEESVTPETADVTVEVTYQTSGDHNNGDHGQTPTNPGDHNDYNNGGNNGNDHVNGNNNGGAINNGTNGAGNLNNGNGQTAKKLPQTGNDQNAEVVAGLGLAGLAAMFGLGKRKKRD